MVHIIQFVLTIFPENNRDFRLESFKPSVIYRIVYFEVVHDLIYLICKNFCTYLFSKESLMVGIGNICREPNGFCTTYTSYICCPFYWAHSYFYFYSRTTKEMNILLKRLGYKCDPLDDKNPKKFPKLHIICILSLG